jgi:very-short-patch-repair endonuclease
MEIDVDDVDRALRRWLRTHHGLVTRAEARQLGATDDVIDARLRRGEWAIVFRTVYRDTVTAPTAHQTLLAACLACGPYAVASHRSAAWLWGLFDRQAATPELTVPTGDQHGSRLNGNGITVHHAADLDSSRTIIRRGIPCTDPIRTLADLGATVSMATLTDAVDCALAGRLATVPGLVAELDRLGRQGRRGLGPLRRVLAARGLVGAPYPSMLESRTLRLFRAKRLPTPAIEVVTGPDGEYRLDTAYVHLQLAIEVDGYAWHFSPEHQRRDHNRRNRLQAQGWRILVYTWRDVVRDGARVAAEIAEVYAALNLASRPASAAAGGWSPPLRTRGPVRGTREGGPVPPSG